MIKPKGYKAEAPNQVWSWDITYLASAVRGSFYYLYMVEDIYSRKIVCWEVHEQENAEHASRLIRKGRLAEGIRREGLILHSDNGSPMRGATMLALVAQSIRLSVLHVRGVWRCRLDTMADDVDR
uniref:Integrase core domain-containing protein n=2 Tax=Candidatus Kentrum sp. TUN TaxID=2126343 RepID=A0A451AAT7_9GAMM|nr:MAG: Integrase core domain-containing protein [Candidatus Kentron sp. TUN]